MLLIISLVCTIFVGVIAPTIQGLEYLFVLPLTFFMICIFSGKIITYYKNSPGLAILYLLIVLRYLISPLFIALSGTLVNGLMISPTSLRFSIFIMVIELITVYVSIRIIWRPVNSSPPSAFAYNGFRFSWTGGMLAIFLVLAIIYRGTMQNIVEHLSFGLNYKFSQSELKTYDMSAFITLKAIIFLLIVAGAARKYWRSKYLFSRTLMFTLAVIAAFFNIMIYDADKRATMVMCSVASLTVISNCFGRRFKKYIPLITILGVIFVWLLFSFGTLGISETNNLHLNREFISDLSRVMELYSNGVSTQAHSIEVYQEIRSHVNLDTYISELIKSNNVFTLPGFWVVGKSVEAIPSFQGLFNKTLGGEAYILPNAGLAFYSGSLIFGLLLDVLFHFFIIVGIYYFYINKQKNIDISKQYLFSYSEMIFGFGLMNNIMIAISLLSDVPLMLYIFLKVNNLGYSQKYNNSINRNKVNF